MSQEKALPTEPTTPSPTTAAAPSSGLGQVFWGAVAGAAGTAIVGLIFSSATIGFLQKMFSHNPFPKDAIILVSASDCGTNSGWKKYEQAQGRFIVAAGDSPDGGPKYPAGLTGVGTSKIIVRQENLPDVVLPLKWDVTDIDIHGKGYAVPRGIGSPTGNSTAPVPLGGKGVAIDTLPSWTALTACRQE